MLKSLDNRMKHLTIITSALILLSSHAFADFTGGMDCKVKSSKVMSIEEGIPREFTGFGNRFDVGDTLTLTYGSEREIVFLDVKDRSRDNRYVWISAKLDIGVVSTWQSSYTDSVGFSGPLQSLTLNPDKIEASSSLQYRIYFHRYYKNDWEGIFIWKIPHFQKVQVATLDCGHTDDQLDKMLNALEREATIQDFKERQIKARAKIQEQLDDKQVSLLKAKVKSSKEKLELFRLQKQALAKQLDEAKKRIAELEAAQE